MCFPFASRPGVRNDAGPVSPQTNNGADVRLRRSSMQKKTLRVGALVAAAALSLGVAACGGDDNNNDSTTSSSSDKAYTLSLHDALPISLHP